MNSISRLSSTVLLVAGLFAACIVAASPGHDHSDTSAVANTGVASPRFDAHSDLFEVVGNLRASELSIFIDQYASNEPLLNAKVELESGGTKLTGQFRVAQGDYSFASKPFEKPGAYPILLTITTADDVDILAGNLLVPDAKAGHSLAKDSTAWKNWAVIGILVVAVGLAVTLFVHRRVGKISHV